MTVAPTAALPMERSRERRLATVFGGTGFLGRYVVPRLRRQGYVVRVATRDPGRANFLRMQGPRGEVVPLFADLARAETVARAIDGARLVVNLVGILAERRRGDFDRVHADGAGRIAAEASRAGVTALVQVSAIGADPNSDSLYGRSKAAGEEAVLRAFPDATVLRPSLVFGPEDQFFNRFASLAMFSPIMPVIRGGTRMQPVYVDDVAAAIETALVDARSGVFELGGPAVMTFREILEWILRETHRRRPLVTVPTGIASLQAAFAERLPGKPFTRDQLRMLGYDNVVAPGAAGLEQLGITPMPIELVVPHYLDRYRPGGLRRIVPS